MWRPGLPVPEAYVVGTVGNICDKCGYRFVVLVQVFLYAPPAHNEENISPESHKEWWCKTCVENN